MLLTFFYFFCIFFCCSATFSQKDKDGIVALHNNLRKSAIPKPKTQMQSLTWHDGLADARRWRGATVITARNDADIVTKGLPKSRVWGFASVWTDALAGLDSTDGKRGWPSGPKRRTSIDTAEANASMKNQIADGTLRWSGPRRNTSDALNLCAPKITSSLAFTGPREILWMQENSSIRMRSPKRQWRWRVEQVEDQQVKQVEDQRKRRKMMKTKMPLLSFARLPRSCCRSSSWSHISDAMGVRRMQLRQNLSLGNVWESSIFHCKIFIHHNLYMCKEERRCQSLKKDITFLFSMILKKINFWYFFFLKRKGKNNF